LTGKSHGNRSYNVFQVDGVEENLPFNHAPSGLNIRASGRFVVLKTSFGLKVVYDGRSYLTVELPASFRYQVEGK